MTDWELIININLDDLNDEKAELLYDQLIEINPDDESNIDLLRSAFKAAKCVMQVKALQADVAVEELEEYIKKNDKNELETLRRQVDMYKSTLLNQHGLDSMNQIKDYQNQISDLKESLETKNNELSRSKRRLGDLETKLQANEKEIESLQDEIEGLKEEMESRQHGIQDSIAESAEPLEKLREKNKQIQSLLDELDLMERANVELARQVKTLKDQLSIATSEVKSAADEMESMRSQCSDIQEMNEMLIKEKEYLMKEVDALRKELDSVHDKHDNLIGQLNEKVDQLVQMVREKDDVIKSLKGTHLNFQGTEASNERSSSTSQQELTEKGQTIDFLKDQLADAVNTIQGQNELIKKFTKKEGSTPKEKILDEDNQVAQLTKQINQLQEKIDQLEEELKTKDDELHQVIMMKTAYERGEYGLSEALNEVKSLKKQLLAKERHLEEAIQDLNQLSIKLNSYEDQLDFLKEMGGTLSGLSSLDTDKILPEVTNDRLKILRLQQTIIKLEDEKIGLQEKLRSMKSVSSASGSPKLDLRSSVDTKKADEERAKMVAHLKTLEDENRELQLGMKEILIGLRESDSQSDVVIDCPSLERLVNLLEGRSLSSDLTNVIALKAELDLLRGHNQELRMELKRLRHEHLKLIGDYTNEILDNQYRHSVKTRSFDYQDQTSNHVKPLSYHPNEDDDSITTTTTTTPTSTIVVNDVEKSNQIDSNYELSEGEVLFSSGTIEPQSEGQLIEGNNDYQSKVIRNGDNDEDNDGDSDESTLEAEETTIDGDLDTQIVDGANLESESQVELVPQPMPRKTRSDKECQTLDQPMKRLVPCFDVICQTEQIESKCTKCSKLLLVVKEIREQIERLSGSITESESHYMEKIELARKENEFLNDHIQCWKEKYNQLLVEKDEILVKSKQRSLSKVDDIEYLISDSTSVDENQQNNQPCQPQQQNQKASTNKAIPKVLETIIQCLQKRIDQKESAIQELQALIRQTHENYELEIAKLIEEKSVVRETIPLDTVSLNRMVQTDELKIALEKCYKELKECKKEAYHRIQSLLQELDKEKSKSSKLQEQIDKMLTVKVKSSSKSVVTKQLKTRH